MVSEREYDTIGEVVQDLELLSEFSLKPLEMHCKLCPSRRSLLRRDRRMTR